MEIQTTASQQSLSQPESPLPTSPVSLVSGQSLITLLEHREALKAQADALNSELDGINHILRTELAIRSTRRLEIDRFVVQNVIQERKSLSKEKLLEAGVTLKQLEAGTIVTPGEQLRVSGRRTEP